MKKCLILSLMLVACSTPHKVSKEERLNFEHHEIIGAEWHDSLRVTFHDVVIIPRDTLWDGGARTSAPPKIKIARVEVERKSEARVDVETDTTVITETTHQTTPQSPSSTWKCIPALMVIVLATILITIYRHKS